MPIPVFEYCVTVQPSDIDEMNHANNVCYVRWMQEAAIAHSTYNGWSTPRYLESGFAWVARRHTIEYLQPALVGDKLIVQTWVADFKRVTSRRKYRFLRKSDLIGMDTKIESDSNRIGHEDRCSLTFDRSLPAGSFVRGNRVIAVAETHWAFLSIKHRRPVKIPPEVADCFLPVGEEPTQSMLQS